MDRKEFAIYASALKAYYPKEKILQDERSLELWYRALQDIPFKLAEETLKEWVFENKFSPSIAEIRDNAKWKVRIDEIETITGNKQRIGYEKPLGIGG